MLRGSPNGSFMAAGRRTERHDQVCERVRPDGLLPADLLRLGWLDDASPVHPVDHLQVEQVEVHGMGIHADVAQLPEHGYLRSQDFRRRVHVEGGPDYRPEPHQRGQRVRGGAEHYVHPPVLHVEAFGQVLAGHHHRAGKERIRLRAGTAAAGQIDIRGLGIAAAPAGQVDRADRTERDVGRGRRARAGRIGDRHERRYEVVGPWVDDRDAANHSTGHLCRSRRPATRATDRVGNGNGHSSGIVAAGGHDGNPGDAVERRRGRQHRCRRRRRK